MIMDQLNLDQIKARIRRHLNKVKEDTAKNIAKTTGDDPHFVIQALNSMRTYTEVECEKKKGKGNEYWYWLTNAAAELPESDTLGMSAAKVMGVTAVEVAGELRTKLENAEARNRELEALLEVAQREAKSIGDVSDQNSRIVMLKQERIDELEGIMQRIFLQLEFVPGDDIEHKVAQVMHDRIHDRQTIDHLSKQVAENSDAVDVTADEKVATERARRIVACVNACAGIPDDMISHVVAFGLQGHNKVSDELADAKEQLRLKDEKIDHITEALITSEKHRDELLSALEACVDVLDRIKEKHGIETSAEIHAGGVIARAKGGAA